jgi:hypothetical protein
MRARIFFGNLRKKISKRDYVETIRTVSKDDLATIADEENDDNFEVSEDCSLQIDLGFQEFFFSRPQPVVKYHRKRSPNYRYIK